MVGDRTVGVLHVDDDPAMLELMVAFLERRDTAVRLETVADARSALETLRADPAAVDVVVSDYALRDEGGLAFLDAVRAEFPDLPFIFYTGRVDGEAAARERGATDYIVKGSAETLDELAHRIAEVVDADAGSDDGGTDDTGDSRAEPIG